MTFFLENHYISYLNFRNIKPRNIFVKDNDAVVLGDLGVSTIMGDLATNTRATVSESELDIQWIALPWFSIRFCLVMIDDFDIMIYHSENFFIYIFYILHCTQFSQYHMFVCFFDCLFIVSDYAVQFRDSYNTGYLIFFFFLFEFCPHVIANFPFSLTSI